MSDAYEIEHARCALRRVLKFAGAIRGVNRAAANGGDLYRLLQHLGAGVDGLCSALSVYEKVLEVVGCEPLEGVAPQLSTGSVFDDTGEG